MRSDDLVFGYEIGDIDSAARELMHTLAELDLPLDLSIIVLTRCIAVLGDETDLDMASRLLDDLCEIPFDSLEEDLERDDEGDLES